MDHIITLKQDMIIEALFFFT